LASFVIILLLYSVDSGWSGGNCYGPRFLLPVIAFITIPISATVENYRNNKLFWILFSILFGLSIFNSFIGTITYSHETFVSSNPIWASLLRALDGKLDIGIIGNHYIPKIYAVFVLVLVSHEKIQ